MRKSVQSNGFTLVELMITIAILAILMAIVVPNYQLQINKSRRADAKATLMGEAQSLERCFTDTDTYLGCEPNNYNPPASDPAIPSYKGYYVISAADGAITSTEFKLTATPKPGGEQISDTKCISFTLNHLGEKTAVDSDGNDTTGECWN